ncbi:MAG: hypothetical protein RLZZ609_730 [Cyanobacteriota bacterium]|jgi:DNA-binding transcriptional ArsR family regulator
MASLHAMPSSLRSIATLIRLLSELARLQPLCLLKQTPTDVASLIEATGFSPSHISRQLGQWQRGGLVRSVREGVRLTYHADSALVVDLCPLVQNRLRERLERQLQTLAGG